MKALGRQILIEFYECSSEVLNDLDKIRRCMVEAAERSGAHVVEEVFHMFSPHGVSGSVVIAESHLSIHTWPEYGYAAVDLFTCGDDVDPWVAFEYLKTEFESTHHSATELKRGLFPFNVANKPGAAMHRHTG